MTNRTIGSQHPPLAWATPRSGSSVRAQELDPSWAQRCRGSRVAARAALGTSHGRRRGRDANPASLCYGRATKGGPT